MREMVTGTVIRMLIGMTMAMAMATVMVKKWNSREHHYHCKPSKHNESNKQPVESYPTTKTKSYPSRPPYHPHVMDFSQSFPKDPRDTMQYPPQKKRMCGLILSVKGGRGVLNKRWGMTGGHIRRVGGILIPWGRNGATGTGGLRIGWSRVGVGNWKWWSSWLEVVEVVVVWDLVVLVNGIWHMLIKLCIVRLKWCMVMIHYITLCWKKQKLIDDCGRAVQ